MISLWCWLGIHTWGKWKKLGPGPFFGNSRPLGVSLGKWRFCSKCSANEYRGP